MPARDTPPHICPRIEASRRAHSASLVLIFLHDGFNFPLDLGKGVKPSVGDVVLDTVFFQAQPLPGKEHISFSRSRQVGYTVADEDDKGDLSILVLSCRYRTTLLDGQRLVMAEFSVVPPNRFPFGAIGLDLRVVGNDPDLGSLLFANSSVRLNPQWTVNYHRTSSFPRKVASTLLRIGLSPALITLNSMPLATQNW